MEQLPVSQVVGVGALALGFGGILLKIWRDSTTMMKEHRKEQSLLTEKVIQVVEKDAQTKAELKAVINEDVKATKETKDMLSKVLLELIEKRNQ
jgi:ethanolamine utilization protein EutA (predicted chaperonin)